MCQNDEKMTRITIKPPINSQLLDKPYLTGIFYGILIGMGISKMMIDLVIGNTDGLLIGLIVFVGGVILASRGLENE